jgi:hypothetical protein
MTDLKKFKIAGDAVLAALDAARDAYAARDAARDASAARDTLDLAARDASAAVRDTYATYNAILAAQKQETPQ